MTELVWEKAFNFTIGSEGGFQADRADRGNWTTGVIGKGQLKGTKFGISAFAYPDLDIKNLTIEQAKEIYHRDYWLKSKCDRLPDPLSMMVFDYAVNSGSRQAIRDLQRSLCVAADGIIGNQTIGAAHSKPLKPVIENYYNRRMNLFMANPNWAKYKNGWSRRALSLKEMAERMV